MPTDDTIRAAILAELARREMTTYALWRLCPSIGKTTVYRFAKGEASLSTVAASVMLAALGLEVVRGSGKIDAP